MKLLLDTQVFLYAILDSPALPLSARSLIESLENELFLSIASVWEIAIKVGLGKLTLAQPLDRLVPDHMTRAGIVLLPITIEHAATVATLPFHHRDPFDRMLAAQSMADGLPLVSGDTVFDRYAVRRLW